MHEIVGDQGEWSTLQKHMETLRMPGEPEVLGELALVAFTQWAQNAH